MTQTIHFSDYNSYDYFSPYPVTPVYLDLLQRHRLSQELRLLSDLLQTEPLAETGAAGTEREGWSELFQGLQCGLLSNRGPAARTLPGRTAVETRRILLGVERFFPRGNFGSGRHARIRHFEVKGVGRNSCAVRSDLHHSWGGLDVFSAISERLLSAQMNSIAPRGAVPVTAITVLSPDATPLVMQNAAPGSGAMDYLILAQLWRPASYVRLANIYFGSMRTDERFHQQDYPGIREVIEHYACLTAYGSFHSMPTDDNLTLDGALLDVASLFVKMPDPAVEIDRRLTTPQQGQTFSRKEVLQLFAADDMESTLAYCCGAAAHLYTIERIATYRARLWQEELPSNWQSLYLRRVAFYWLIRNGFSAAQAEQEADQLSPAFTSLVVDPRARVEDFLAGRSFKVIRGADKSSLRISLRNPAQETQLSSFLKSRPPCSQLLQRYNYRKAEYHSCAILPADFRSVSGDQLFQGIFQKIQRTEILSRQYSPYSLANREDALQVERATSRLRIYGRGLGDCLDAYSQSSDARVLIACLTSNGRLQRKSVKAERRDLDLIVKSADMPAEYLIEGFEIQDGSAGSHFPLTLTHVRQSPDMRA